MNTTTILDETYDSFSTETGEITRSTKHKVLKSKIEATDEFVKVSKYLNLIFAYHGIPLNLVPIALLFAQRMEFKTNILYLLKDDKEEIAEMLGIKLNMVEKKITDCRTYDIIRPTNSRGKYVVNSFLFSTGNTIETRNLQARFDLDSDLVLVNGDQRSLITGQSVRKIVANQEPKKRLFKNEIPGQLSLDDMETYTHAEGVEDHGSQGN